jgi:hypothetical protein
VEVIGDSASRSGRNLDVVGEPIGLFLQFLVIVEVPEIKFFEDILHGYELRDVLLVKIRLCLFDIVGDLPDMQGIDIAINEPHLIDNKYEKKIS